MYYIYEKQLKLKIRHLILIKKKQDNEVYMEYRKRAVFSQVKSEQLVHSNVTILFHRFRLENLLRSAGLAK